MTTTLKQRFALLAQKKPEISQADLARMTGAKPPSVNGWFKGSTLSLKATTAARIAEIYDCNPNWLATGNGNPFPLNQDRLATSPADADVVKKTIDLLAALNSEAERGMASMHMIDRAWPFEHLTKEQWVNIRPEHKASIEQIAMQFYGVDANPRSHGLSR